jgi:eukaryotic-like serine/threonine-protein kinase
LKKHAEVRALFLEAVQLPPTERQRFLRSCGAAEDVLKQVNDLLEHASPATVLNVDAPGRATQAGSFSRLWPYLRLLGPLSNSGAKRWSFRLLLLGLFLGGGFLLRNRALDIATNQAMSTLRGFNESIAISLQQQVSEWIASVEAPVAGGLGRAAAIAQLTDPSPEHFDRFLDRVGDLIGPERFIGFQLITPQGMTYGYRIDRGSREVLPPARVSPFGMQALARAFQNQRTVVTLPGIERISAASEGQGELIPYVTLFVPLIENGKPIGVFAAVRDAAGVFRILQRARTSQSGENYLVTTEGLLLSPSRFEADMERWGLLEKPKTKGARPLIWARDPGRSLYDQPPEPGENTKAWAPTLVVRTLEAARATRDPKGFSGIIQKPYLDYRGQEEVAAWHWLPELGVGLATEADTGDIFATLNLIDAMLLGLVGCIGVAGLWATMSTSWLLRLRGQMEKGNQLGSYSLIEKIGEGGMGEVYIARHALLRRTAALKLLRRDRTDDASFSQFEKEARLVSSLRHPNTVEVYDFGRAKDGTFYFVMQYLPGHDLHQWVKKTGAMSVARSIHVVRQVCSALCEAHSEGLLHCDVKPSNVMLCATEGLSDFAKLLDFGLAFSTRERSARHDESASGTPYFTAPERLRGDPIDARTDIYSLGVLWFYLLTARLPQGAGMHWVEATLTTDAAPTSSFVPVDPEVDALIASCVARDPNARPTSTMELLDRLNRLSLRFVWTEEEARKAWTSLGRT